MKRTTKKPTAIYCYLQPVNRRKAVDGLNMITAEHKNDTQKNLSVFRNKNSNKVKCLFWDQNGYVLYYKRLEKGRFRFPSPKEHPMELSLLPLRGLLRDLAFVLLKEDDDLLFFDFS